MSPPARPNWRDGGFPGKLSAAREPVLGEGCIEPDRCVACGFTVHRGGERFIGQRCHPGGGKNSLFEKGTSFHGFRVGSAGGHPRSPPRTEVAAAPFAFGGAAVKSTTPATHRHPFMCHSMGQVQHVSPPSSRLTWRQHRGQPGRGLPGPGCPAARRRWKVTIKDGMWTASATWPWRSCHPQKH